MNIDEIIFEPVSRNFSGGNENQHAKTLYKGVEIHERTFFPWNFMKPSLTWYIVDLIFPIGTMECLTDKYYTEEGFGVPEVDTLEEAIAIIDNFKSGKYEN